MAAAKKTKAACLFDELFALGKEGLRNARKPILARRVKAELQKERDNQEELRLDAQEALTEMRNSLATETPSYSAQEVITISRQIIRAENRMRDIDTELKELFGDKA